jgi:hypothetical protein
MDSLDGFVMNFFKMAASSGMHIGKTCVVVRQPYMHLKKDLEKVFEGQTDVKVVVDMRTEDRRRGDTPVAQDRRLSDRRKEKPEMVQAVVFI